jgi:hypothetical protein
VVTNGKVGKYCTLATAKISWSLNARSSMRILNSIAEYAGKVRLTPRTTVSVTSTYWMTQLSVTLQKALRLDAENS